MSKKLLESELKSLTDTGLDIYLRPEHVKREKLSLLEQS